MLDEIEGLLAKGLREGFAGGTVRRGVRRGGFELESSHFESGSDIYHDEWHADRAGGGQEIVMAGEKTFTRVYAGGTVPLERLEKLGITKGDVMAFLKKQMIENGEKIRLHTNFEPEAEGDWQYSYRVLDRDPEIPLTLGKEVIMYKGRLVFVHAFIISPVD